MLERWKKGSDNSKIVVALLTDLSKAFYCLNHELLIAKLHAYGFDNQALLYTHSYLSDRKQKTKVNNSLSGWCDILSRVHQGSIIGPFLFNIYLNGIFYFTNGAKVTNYADDTTPYVIEEDFESLIKTFQMDVSLVIKWFQDNYFQMNADKCQFLASNHEAGLSIKVGGEVIQSKKSVKLLGITIDNKLRFNEYVSNICTKVSMKLRALARVSHYEYRKIKTHRKSIY